MKIVFSLTISKKEKLRKGDIKDIIKAFSKGVFTKIKGDSLPKYSELIKIYMTTIGGVRRAVFLVNTPSGDSFFLMYRSKNDPLGKNITIKNPQFKRTLLKYLDILEEDIKCGALEIYNVG